MNLDEMVEKYFQRMGAKGEVFVLNHLRSEKGKAMNGRRVVVVGMDPRHTLPDRRIQVRLLDQNNTQQPTGKILQIKPRNLVVPKDYCSIQRSSAKLPDEKVIQMLKTALEHCKDFGFDKDPTPEAARDSFRRFDFVKKSLEQNTLPNGSGCMDLFVPFDEHNLFERFKWIIIPACVGDGIVDFTRFGEGIIGGHHEDDECAICVEHITSDLVRLPCDHRFHLHCVKPWFIDHAHITCPTCRQELTNSWDTYVYPVSYDQIQKRFDEWFVSGMCERCQELNHESNPVVEVVDENGQKINMPLSYAKKEGYTEYRLLQGVHCEEVNVLIGA